MNKKNHSHLPIIAISGSSPHSASVQAMWTMLKSQGAQPVFLEHDISILPKQLAGIDGLVIMGNDWDIHSNEYGQPLDNMTRIPDPHDNYDIFKLYQQRMDYEKDLVQCAIRKKIPLLGICGGMQRINITPDPEHPELEQGTLIQHLSAEDSEYLQHNISPKEIPPFTPVQFIKIQPDSELFKIVQEKKGWFNPVEAQLPDGIFLENSIHHQAVEKVRGGFQAAAYGSDGVIEAIEVAPDGVYGKQWVYGIQFHPEFCASSIGYAISSKLVEQARDYSQSRTQSTALKQELVVQSLPHHVQEILSKGKEHISGLFADRVKRQHREIGSPAMTY